MRICADSLCRVDTVFNTVLSGCKSYFCTQVLFWAGVGILGGGHYSTECRMLNAIYYFTELSAEYALWRSTIQ
jgi:hypothetical protein